MCRKAAAKTAVATVGKTFVQRPARCRTSNSAGDIIIQTLFFKIFKTLTRRIMGSRGRYIVMPKLSSCMQIKGRAKVGGSRNGFTTVF